MAKTADPMIAIDKVLGEMNKMNTDAFCGSYALGYTSSIVKSFLSGESKASQRRFLRELEYYIAASAKKIDKGSNDE
jgi:hypothetical protein